MKEETKYAIVGAIFFAALCLMFPFLLVLAILGVIAYVFIKES
jgi:hypothetical protein